MKKLHLLFSLVNALLLFLPSPGLGQIKLPEEFKVRLGRLARLEAVCDTPLKWINLHEDLDVFADSSGKAVFILGAKAGRYKIAAFTSGKDGPSDPAYCVIVVEGPGAAPPPGPQLPGAADPVNATCKIIFGRSGCTATVVWPRRPDGKWDLLTAAHCTTVVGATGKATFKDGRVIDVSVSVRATGPDICWLVTESSSIASLPFAMIVKENPSAGVAIWHNGYGIDRPGSKETGKVLSGPDQAGQMKYYLSVSSGDSGGGIFRLDSGELTGCVCCTSSMARNGSVWGGSAVLAQQMRPKGTAEEMLEADPSRPPPPDAHGIGRIHPIEIRPR